jgi:hypothetical protein
MEVNALAAEISRLESFAAQLNDRANDALDWGAYDALDGWERELADVRERLRHLYILRDGTVPPPTTSPEEDLRASARTCLQHLRHLEEALEGQRETMFNDEKWLLGQAMYVYALKVQSYQGGDAHVAAIGALGRLATTASYHAPAAVLMDEAARRLDRVLSSPASQDLTGFTS